MNIKIKSALFAIVVIFYPYLVLPGINFGGAFDNGDLSFSAPSLDLLPVPTSLAVPF